ncbi:hypothetical protein N0V91_009872 [Didymella pomorum]|uniref:Uncharacterized protein n=1 Tax=Didymella pomorum TaxID=749634 RepID=A0A9W8Z6P7_9PLEO|nr:hypothetical protein N0V91_009872 [Didymella pomorum]
MAPMQTQREVVLTIRDPSTVLSLRAMNPRNLNAHVERAIAQSRNENIDSIKVLSSNQLRSGDLSIRTATNKEVEALKQFEETRDQLLLDNKPFIPQAEIKYVGWLTRNASCHPATRSTAPQRLSYRPAPPTPAT